MFAFYRWKCLTWIKNHTRNFSSITTSNRMASTLIEVFRLIILSFRRQWSFSACFFEIVDFFKSPVENPCVNVSCRLRTIDPNRSFFVVADSMLLARYDRYYRFGVNRFDFDALFEVNKSTMHGCESALPLIQPKTNWGTWDLPSDCFVLFGKFQKVYVKSQ